MAKKAKGEHYVNNKEFLEAMVAWREKCAEAEQKGKEQPPVTNYIGECFLKIATHLSYRPNFINYTYRDEMISDGIENCLQYVANFNPEKSKNPFAYFTQIIYYAFLRRIQKEKKQTHVKNKMIEKNNFESKVDKYNNYIQSNLEFNENIILNEILQIVENIAIEKKIDLVLNENQYYLSSDEINISNIIIQKLNKINLKLARS